MLVGASYSPQRSSANSKRNPSIKSKVIKRRWKSVGTAVKIVQSAKHQSKGSKVQIPKATGKEQHTEPDVQEKSDSPGSIGADNETKLLAQSQTQEDKKDDEEGRMQEKTQTANVNEKKSAGFRKIFDMFDKNGRGTIKANDLDQALQFAGMKSSHLTKEGVVEIFKGANAVGNGEIKFNKFKPLVAEAEKFHDNIVARNNEGKHHRRLRDVLFEYLARFVYKSSLASVEDIFRRYRKKEQNVHVLCHYTAGEKLLGQTERQMRRQFTRLTEITSGSRSPYAQPIVAWPETFFGEQKDTRKLRLKQGQTSKWGRNQWDKIKQEITSSQQSKKIIDWQDSGGLRSSTMYKSSKKRDAARRSTILRRMKTFESSTRESISWPISKSKLMDCDSKKVAKKIMDAQKLTRNSTFNDMRLIRKHVSDITADVHKRIKSKKLRAAEKHLKDLGVEEIKSPNVKARFQEMVLVYTNYKNLPITSITTRYADKKYAFTRI